MKKFVIVLIIASMLSTQFTYAHEDKNNKTQNEENFVEAVAPFGDDTTSGAGTLTKKELSDLRNKLKEQEKQLYKDIEKNKNEEQSIMPMHISWPHIHVIDRITRTYDGYYDIGEVASGYNNPAVNNDETLTYGETRSVSNSCNVSISFSSDVVTARVGYDVTWSDSSYFSYSMGVPEGYTGYIHLQKWYHVKDFDCHTEHIGLLGDPQYGTGTSKQWWKPHYYTSTVYGNQP